MSATLEQEAAYAGTEFRRSLEQAGNLVSWEIEVAAYKMYRWDDMFGTVSGSPKDYIVKALMVAAELRGPECGSDRP